MDASWPAKVSTLKWTVNGVIRDAWASERRLGRLLNPAAIPEVDATYAPRPAPSICSIHRAAITLAAMRPCGEDAPPKTAGDAETHRKPTALGSRASRGVRAASVRERGRTPCSR